jgi:hypothetical protein
VLGGRLLSNLSHQANYLGRYHEALQFARAAQASARGRATDTVAAMFLAMEARALASSGDARQCATALNLAEQAFARRDRSKDPQWISYFDELELADEAAHCVPPGLAWPSAWSLWGDRQSSHARGHGPSRWLEN